MDELKDHLYEALKLGWNSRAGLLSAISKQK